MRFDNWVSILLSQTPSHSQLTPSEPKSSREPKEVLAQIMAVTILLTYSSASCQAALT